MKIAWASLQRYDLPLTGPLQVRPGVLLHRRVGLVVTLANGHGDFGYGEIAPLPGFSAEPLALAIRQASDFLQVLKGQPVMVDPIALLGGTAAWHAVAPSVRAGISMALISLQANTAREPIAHRIASEATERVGVNAFVAGDPDDWTEQAHRLRGLGYQAVKVKVGRAPRKAEAEALHSMQLMLGPEVQFRLDANRAWDLDTAIAFAQCVDGLNVAYFEEPLAEPSDLPEFHFATGQAYALDETIAPLLGRWCDDALEPVLPKGADRAGLERLVRLAGALVIKPTLCGEYARLPEILRALPGFSGRAVVSSTYETELGLSLLAQLSGALDGNAPAGLDTAGIFEVSVLDALPPNGPEWDLASLAARLRGLNTRLLEDVCRV